MMNRPRLRRILLATLLATAVTSAGAQFPVLYYHAHPNFGYSDALFAQHMDFLRTNGYHTVSGDQFLGWLTNSDALPIRPLLLTVDDNYIRVYSSVAPILEARGFQAISFAHTTYVGVGGANDHADWVEINEMETSGVVRTESHTQTHPNLTTLGPDALTTELQGSKAAIEANIPGKTCRYLCYPGGAYDTTVTAAVGQAGYAAAFTTVSGLNFHNTPLYELKRQACDGLSLAVFQNQVGFGTLPPAPPGPGWTIDNRDVNFFHQASDWQVLSPASGAYGTDCLVRSAGNTGIQSRWAAYLPAAGSWRVHAWWVAGADRSANAVYKITHPGGTTPVGVSQRVNGGKWNLLGTFAFTSSSPAQVTLSQSADGAVVADGIWFEPVTAGVNDSLSY